MPIVIGPVALMPPKAPTSDRSKMPLESSPGARVWLLTAIEKGFVAQPGLGRVETGIRQQADAESIPQGFGSNA
jgi:hypothetical protein